SVNGFRAVSVLHLPEQRLLGTLQFRRVITARKHAAVDVGGHGDRGMTEELLYRLERQLPTAIDLPAEAPGGEEMPQAVQSRVLGRAVPLCHAGRDLDRPPCPGNDVRMVQDGALGVREYEIELLLLRRPFRALELP